MQTKTRNAQQSRKDILAAAERVFGEKGFYGARIDEIAQASGLNKQMIYVYYGSKEELYRQVLVTIYHRMELVERELLATDLTGEALITAVIEAYFRFLSNNPNFVNILMSENLMHAQFLKQIPREFIARQTIDELSARIDRCRDDGVFRAGIDGKQVIFTLITICFSNYSNRHTLSQLLNCDLNDEGFLEDRKAAITDIMLSYLVKKP